MKTLSLEFKVGLFVILAFVVLGYMLFVLSPDSFDNDSYTQYYTRLSNARGIVPKTHVRTNGVVVGKVKAVNLEDNITRVDLEVAEKVRIPKGSKIEVRSKGILGDVFIEIIRVPSGGEYIQAKEEIPVVEGQVGMEELVGILGGIAQDVKKVTATLADIFGDQAGKRDLREIVTNLSSFTRNIDELIKENRSNVKATMDNLSATTETLKVIIANNRDTLQEIVENVRDTTEKLKAFSGNMAKLANDENIKKMDRIIAAIDDSMVDVKDSMKNIRVVTHKMSNGEGTLGRLVTDDQLIDDLQGALHDLRDVLAPATKLEVGVDYHGEFRKDNTTQHYFNMLFKTRPDKYFLIGMTDVENDIETKKIETLKNESATDENPAYVTTKETRNLEKRLKFNLQYARRFYFSTIRFGLFENSGGLATDFHFFGDTFKLTLEAFDWKSKGNEIRRVAHLKTYASVLFFSHIYALVGIDDITRLDEVTGKTVKNPNYFVGGGMSFNDNDLKAIFGTAALTLQ